MSSNISNPLKKSDGSSVALMDGEDPSPKPRVVNSSVKIILMVIMGVCFAITTVALVVAVIYLNTNINFVETLSELDIRGQRVMLPSPIPTSPAAETADMSIDGVHKTDIELFQNINDNSESDHAAIFLTASVPYKSFRKGKEDRLHTIDIWNGSTSDNTVFEIEDNEGLKVPQNGIYHIYAQLSWRKRGGMASFVIQKSGQDYEDGTVVEVARCITNFPENYAALQSCYTSVVVHLNKADRLSVAVHEDNFTLDLQKTGSFFGVMLLQED